MATKHFSTIPAEVRTNEPQEAVGRRLPAANVVALWPDDRPVVVNPTRRGRFSGNVERLRLRLGLRQGAMAQLKGLAGSPNHGAMVRLLWQDATGDWNVEGVHAPLILAGGGVALSAWVPPHRLRVFTDQGAVLRRLRADQAPA